MSCKCIDRYADQKEGYICCHKLGYTEDEWAEKIKLVPVNEEEDVW